MLHRDSRSHENPRTLPYPLTDEVPRCVCVR